MTAVGYFRDRISRSRCAADVAAAVRRQARAAGAWVEAPASPPPPTPRASYLRFAVGKIDPDSQVQLGVFQACYKLRDSETAGVEEVRLLREVLRWFDENLRAPSSVSPRAVFWFKSGANDCLGKVWEMIALLKAHDVPTWMMRCQSPGQVVYDDDYQVAAVPQRGRRQWQRSPV